MAENTLARLLTPQEVADLLGIPLRTLYTQRSTGRPTPRAIRIGKHLRFTEQSVADFIAEHTEPAA